MQRSVTFLLLLFIFSFSATAKEDVDLFARYATEVVDASLTGADVSALNRREVESLELSGSARQTSREGDKAEWISRTQAERLVSKMQTHQVVGEHMEPVYDPNGCNGFCFGRALYSHLELLVRGVSKTSIKKVFVIGPLKHEGMYWDFHVTTIVRGPGSIWWVLDVEPWSRGLMTLEDWLPLQESYAVDRRARIYITDPSTKLTPNSSARKEVLESPSYRGYFSDLLAYFRDRRLAPEHRLSRCEAAFSPK